MTTHHRPHHDDAIGIPPVAMRSDIACTPDDNDWFYPEDKKPRRTPNTARRICGRCPHWQDCLTWALDTRQPYGIWGGLTAAERSQLIKKDTPRIAS